MPDSNKKLLADAYNACVKKSKRMDFRLAIAWNICKWNQKQ